MINLTCYASVHPVRNWSMGCMFCASARQNFDSDAVVV